jgi:hypothetical protein
LPPLVLKIFTLVVPLLVTVTFPLAISDTVSYGGTADGKDITAPVVDTVPILPEVAVAVDVQTICSLLSTDVTDTVPVPRLPTILVAVIIDPIINALVAVRPNIVNVKGAISVAVVNGLTSDTVAPTDEVTVLL